MAQYFEDVELDHIVSSSLLRARQTADIVARRKHQKIMAFPDLDEMNFGDFEGRKVDEIDEELTYLHKTWQSGEVQLAPENGESPQHVYDRANRQVRKLLDAHAGQTLLLVVHGRLIRILLSNWLGLGLARMQDVEHANAAVNLLNWHHAGELFEPVFLNQTDHLSSMLEAAEALDRNNRPNSL